MKKDQSCARLTTRKGLVLLAVVAGAVAQQLPPTSGSKPTFDVATIKPAQAGKDGGRIRTLPGGQTFTASNVALRNLITTAYSVRADQISGGPGWANSDGYDIEGKGVAEPEAKQRWE